MLPGKIPLLAFFTALFIAFIIYACKSVKPRATASLDQQSSILIFAKTTGYTMSTKTTTTNAMNLLCAPLVISTDRSI